MEMEIEESGGGGALHAQHSDVDLAAVAEKEYQRMKRQYMLMQRNRQSLADKAGSRSAARSSRLTRLLESHKEDLESDITAATSVINQRKDEVTKEKIWKLLQLYEKYKTQATSLNKEIDSMNRTLVKMTGTFYKAKLVIQRAFGPPSSIGRIERTIENNENKLHMVKSNYDMLMTENNFLKEDIGLKVNRRFVIFHRLDILHRRMAECRHDLTTKVDEALQVYNIWDDAHKRINFIKDKYKEEVRQHILEVKEYDRLLFHDLREIRFYSTKNRPRALLETEAQKEAEKSEKETGSLLKEIKHYEKQFKRLEEFDKSQDVDIILTQYKMLEQKNFGNFQQISDFNSDNIKRMEEIHYLKQELDLLASERQMLSISNEEELIRTELTRDAEKAKLEYLKAQFQVSDEASQRMYKSIDAFVETAECDVTPLSQILGSKEKVDKSNLRAAFNLLEHHVVSILLEKELLSIQNEVENNTTVPTSKPIKMYKPQGGPYDTKLMISGHPELGMEKKDDEEDTLFGVMPIPKSVQREHLLTQLRESGVIAQPRPFNSSDSNPSISIPVPDSTNGSISGASEAAGKGNKGKQRNSSNISGALIGEGKVDDAKRPSESQSDPAPPPGPSEADDAGKKVTFDEPKADPPESSNVSTVSDSAAESDGETGATSATGDEATSDPK